MTVTETIVTETIVTETPRRVVRRHAPVMGTIASIHVHDAIALEAADRAIDATFAEMRRLEAMFTTFRASSEISQVNAGARSLLDCSPEVIDVLDACTWLEHMSDGAFHVRNVRHGGRIDPAGFVKGWATERAARVLREHGLRDWYVAVGGDLLVSGTPGGTGAPWTIAIADPLRAGGALTAVSITDGAVATSGTAERGRHLWGADGAPADTYASVTVIGPSLAWADAFATTACAMGAAGIEWVGRFAGYRAFAITHDGRLVNTR